MSKNKKMRILLLILTLLFTIPAFANNYVESSDNPSAKHVIKDIEKSLLFLEDDKRKITTPNVKNNSDINISAGIVKETQPNPLIYVLVSEPKLPANADVRTKEKMAYNATLSGQYEVARELFKQVIDEEPNNNYALQSLAIIYQKTGQFRQAKSIYYKLLQNNPQNKEEIIGNLIATLLQESPKDGLYLLSRMVAQHPNSSYILSQAALAYCDIKNYPMAIKLSKKAIELEPNRADYRYNLAVIYDKSGSFENAYLAYADSMKYSYDDENGAPLPFDQIERRMESLKKKI